MNASVAQPIVCSSDPDRVVRQRTESIEIELDPDDRMNQFEIGLSKNEACALIRGDVPVSLQEFLIGLLVSLESTPAQGVARAKRKAARS